MWSALVTIGIAVLLHHSNGAITLTPSVASACPNETVTLSCSSTVSTVTSHGWVINVPGCLQLDLIIRAMGDPESISQALAVDSQAPMPADCGSINFRITRVLQSPFVSNLTTTTALDGTTVQCMSGGSNSPSVMINIAVRPDPPDGVMISEVFMSSSVAVTIQWSSPPVASGVSYAVSVTPLNESPVMVEDTSAQLAVMYNTRYSVRIVARNCAGESSPYVMELFYVNCGTPTTGNNVITEGLDALRVAQGTTVTFSCPSEQAYNLTGPRTATCGNDGQWEPDTSGVECRANCGHPMASSNVQLNFNSTLEGAVVLFQCNEGFFPNDTRTGRCQNNSVWFRDPADLVCVNPSGMDCGPPAAPNDGSISSDIGGTLEGARVTFRCNDGFTPSLEMTAECQADGNWEPVPAELVCTAVVTGPDTAGLGGSAIAAIAVVLVIILVIAILTFVIVTAVVMKRKGSSVRKPSSGVELQPTTHEEYSVLRHSGPRGKSQTPQTEGSTLVYADIGPSSVKKPLVKSVNHDDHQVEYSELTHMPLNHDNLSKMHPADETLNLDSLLIQLRPQVTSKWDQFAEVIGVSEYMMKDLSKYGSEERMVELLDYWLRNQPSKPTWREVAKVLKEIHLYQLADDIMRVYETGELPIPFDMNEVPEGTLPRCEPPPPLPPKSMELQDEVDSSPPIVLPPKPPRHGGGSKQPPPRVPAPYLVNDGISPPSRPPKLHGHGAPAAPPRPPKPTT